MEATIWGAFPPSASSGPSNRRCAAATVLQAGVLPYSEALSAIANTLIALCLNNGGLARVRETRVLQAYVPIFTSRK